MAEQTIKISENKEDDITNYYEEALTLENKNNTICPIKKIEIRNSAEFNYKTLNQNSSNYLKNLEMYKNLPDSILTNIIKSRKYISKNHNILFHHYSKEKKSDERNNKNCGKIQSIIINTNLKSLNKEKSSTKTLSNNSQIIYQKKISIKPKSTINTNRQSKKNNNTSHSSIIANYDTNYDYDFDNNENFNYINIESKDKLSNIDFNNYLSDISLKEYMYNETKTLRTAFNYFEKNEKENKEDKYQNIQEKIKNVQIMPPRSKINSDNNILHKQKTQRAEIDINRNEKMLDKKYNSSYIHTYSNSKSTINHKIRGKNKSQENINSYTHRYKMKKIKFKLDIPNKNNNHYLKLLTTKSYNQLSSNGNFTAVNTRRKSFKKEELYLNKNKYNNFLKTQNFYNCSKIDYISFRKNNLNNQKIKSNNKNILREKKDKRIPCKLIKKDLNIITSTSKFPLITNKSNSFSKKDNSVENDKNDKKYKAVSEPKIDKNININNNFTNKSLSLRNKKTYKCNYKNKIESNKKKIFEFKFIGKKKN